MTRRTCLAGILVLLAGAVSLRAQAGSQGHRKLFPPENLGMLEAPDRAAWQKPDQIMDALSIADGSHVADIGAGSGWFTIHLAQRVGPKGVVYAQDVQRPMLEAIRRRVQREGLRNVETRWIHVTEPAGTGARCGSRRRHLPRSRGGRPGDVPAEPRWCAEAVRPGRDRQLQARARRARSR
jgi:SAM-dependent methyltransferase